MYRVSAASQAIGPCFSHAQRLFYNRSKIAFSARPITFTVNGQYRTNMTDRVLGPEFGKLESAVSPQGCDTYKPFLLDEQTTASDWISQLELDTAETMAHHDLQTTAQPLRILILYGSLRKRYEATSLVGSRIESRRPNLKGAGRRL